MAVDPATDIVYVANFKDNTVSVINGATNTVTRTITVGAGPRAVAVDQTRDRIYVVNNGCGPCFRGTVSVIDGATNTVTNTINLGMAGLAPFAVAVNPPRPFMSSAAAT